VSARTVSFRFGLAIMLEGLTPYAVLRACSVAQDHHAYGPSVSSANTFPTAMLVRADQVIEYRRASAHFLVRYFGKLGHILCSPSLSGRFP